MKLTIELDVMTDSKCQFSSISKMMKKIDKNQINYITFDDLLKLCSIFDVTVDEMLGAKPKSIDEQLLYSFEKLSDEKQKIILELMESLQNLP